MADPSGETFCFQKRVVKDAEIFDIKKSIASTQHERGFADVWRKGCFAWEYKGKDKDLDAAYKQLLRYREGLLNPPLLVVCDFDRYIIKTNFNGTVQEKYEFTNAEIDRPENLRILRSLFENPDDLKPKQTTAEVTEKLAGKIAEVARSLQKRESVEIADANTRKKVSFAQRKNLRIARFLNRIIFCFFAEDSRLLPEGLFTDIVKTATEDAKQFAAACENLFRVMSKGGMFGHHKIRHFNGHLFEEATVFELNDAELKILVEAAQADWQFIQPSIMGTLFERALDENQRAQLGAHYTSELDIRTLVEPVLMSPLLQEWTALKGDLARALKKGKTSKEQHKKISTFLKKLSTLVVLDPACGSGNFLYVSLQLLLDLEKEVITLGAQLGMDLQPKISVRQLKAIEINPYAYELAQVSVQIGFLQWRRDNGFDNDRTPVLQVLDGFENRDALMQEIFKKKAKGLRSARKREHDAQESLFKVYIERSWPECDVIVGNPPFLGDKLMRGELGDVYVENLRKIYGDRIPGQSDLCCYWFEKARWLIEHKQCRRAGLLATQGIRGGANREVLKRIKETGDIFFAISDREWILAGANVHVSMVAFDDGSEVEHRLDGKVVSQIPVNLSPINDITACLKLNENVEIGFIGVSMHGDFDMEENQGIEMILETGNPNLKPNSDVVRPVLNAFKITKRAERRWLVSFPPDSKVGEAAGYDAPMRFVRANVEQQRKGNHRKTYRDRWWLLGEARPAMQNALKLLPRFLATPRVSKYRVFVWVTPESLPSDATVAFARSDDYFMGVLQSRFHEVWALKQGTRLETRPRYTPTTCFETFPFPRATPTQETAIAYAAKELNELRERWLNPPEWTVEQTLEFPGSGSGPWQLYIDRKTVDAKTGLGIVRYPRLQPKDASCAAKLNKRTLTNLYNARPAWLDLAHAKLDRAVAVAYGLPADLSEARIMESLLALNLARAAEETSP